MKRYYFNRSEIGKYIGVTILSILIIVIAVMAITPGEKQESTVEPVINVTPIKTPIYDPYMESPELQKYRLGGRSIGEEFQWRRDDVSGTKDIMVRATVYGYRMEPNYQWWSVSWGRYFIQVPEEGMKYLFVYVKVWMEGDSPNWDPSLYGFDTRHFQVQIDGTVYPADSDYVPPIRIKELEEIPNKLNTTRIGPFGCLRMNQAGKESCIGDQWIRMGPENGLDGFIVYKIPAKTRPEDIIVLGQFRGFGSAWWQLS